MNTRAYRKFCKDESWKLKIQTNKYVYIYIYIIYIHTFERTGHLEKQHLPNKPCRICSLLSKETGHQERATLQIQNGF